MRTCTHTHTPRGVAKPIKREVVVKGESKTGDIIYNFKVCGDNMTAAGEECSCLPSPRDIEALFQPVVQQSVGRFNRSGTHSPTHRTHS